MLLKLVEETGVKRLTQLAGSIWWSECVLEDWMKQLTIVLHKKRAHEVCDDFRGIALLSACSWYFFCRVIWKRLAKRVN